MVKNILVIGGAGFIGCNIANHYAAKGHDVTIFDNFSRKGSEKNAAWLQETHKNINVVKGDVRTDYEQLRKLMNKTDHAFNFAAQVTVTTSVTDPREDFEINALGTFNVLEAVRNSTAKPTLLFASTNKVYGGMEDVTVAEKGKRYEYDNHPNGIGEDRPLDFHSPYGCSKGAADQYAHDYARIYGLKTVVFRMSCIYGYRQFGIEDQGWVAWFMIASLLNKPLTIYGDGKQVRDVLFIDDYVAACDAAITNIEKTKGQIYNIGGGPKNTLSLLELVTQIETLQGTKLKYGISDWRPGDQKVYVSDISKAKRDFNWAPKVNPQQGTAKLFKWISDNKSLFE